MKFTTMDEVIERANNTSYGLAAGVCTRDVGRALATSKALRAGSVWVNCFLVVDPSAPFGGFKVRANPRIARHPNIPQCGNYWQLICWDVWGLCRSPGTDASWARRACPTISRSRTL